MNSDVPSVSARTPASERLAARAIGDNIHTARNSIVRFLEGGNPDDEFFLVSFNQKTTLVQGFTHQSSSIRNEISFSNPGGRTALYDAVYLGLEQIKKGKNEKKALILITDGEDNSSRYSASEVRDFAKESDVQIYGKVVTLMRRL